MHIHSRLLCGAAAALFVCGAAASASAQSVTVLEFGSSGADAESDEFYNALRTQIEMHRDYDLNDVPSQSLDDLLLAVGCVELNADCAAILSDVLMSDSLAWGELSHVGGQYSVRLTLWDLASGDTERIRTHVLLGTAELLSEMMPVLARSLLYDESSTLTVESNPPGAVVELNGDVAGETPVTIRDLEMGIYNVAISLDGYQTRNEVIVVDLGSTDESWGLTPLSSVADNGSGNDTDSGNGNTNITEPRERTSGGGSDVPAFVMMGAGGAMIVGGVIFGVMESGTQSDFDAEVERVDWNPQVANDLADKGRQQALVANILLGAGAVAAGVGVILLVTGGDSESDTASGPQFLASPVLTPDHVGFSLSGSF